MTEVVKPAEKPRWATGGTASLSTPPSSKQDVGWARNLGGTPEKPPLQYFNWLSRWTYEWIEWLEKHQDLNLGAQAISELAIVSDAITPTSAVHSVASETGTADDLATIDPSNFDTGRLLLIQGKFGHTITMKHTASGSGKVSLLGDEDAVLSSNEHWVMLQLTSTGLWRQVFSTRSKLSSDPAPKLAADLDANSRAIAGATSVKSAAFDSNDAAEVLTVGAGAQNIVIGNVGATVEFLGTLLKYTVTNAEIKDALITLNKGGTTATSPGSGIEIEEGGAITAYMKLSADRRSFIAKSASALGIIAFSPSLSSASTTTFGTEATADRTHTFPDFNTKVASADRAVDAREFASLNAAVTALTTLGGNRTLVIVSTLDVTANVSVPKAIKLKFEAGGHLAAAAPRVVTINGGLEADPSFQIFASNITIAGAPICDVINLRWFGAVGDNATDDSPSLNRAIASINAIAILYAPTLVIQPGLYVLATATTPITVGCTIRGSGYATVLKPEASVNALRINDVQVSVSDIYFYGASFRTGYGLYIDQKSGNTSVFVSNCRFGNLQRGFYLFGNGASLLKHAGTILSNLEIRDCIYGGYLDVRAEYVQISNMLANSCETGLYCVSGNLLMSNSNLSDNVIGLDLAQGENDAHGTISACQFNHCSTWGIKIGALNTKVMAFLGCHSIDGDIYLNACRNVTFDGCLMTNSSFTFEGTDGARFRGCTIDASPIINNNSNSAPSFVQWQDTRTLDGILNVRERRGGYVSFSPSTTQTIANGVTATLEIASSVQETSRNAGQTKYALVTSHKFKNFGLGGNVISLNLNFRLQNNASVTDWTQVWANIRTTTGAVCLVPCTLIKIGASVYPFMTAAITFQATYNDEIWIDITNNTGHTLTCDGGGGWPCDIEGL